MTNQSSILIPVEVFSRVLSSPIPVFYGAPLSVCCGYLGIEESSVPQHWSQTTEVMVRVVLYHAFDFQNLKQVSPLVVGKARLEKCFLKKGGLVTFRITFGFGLQLNSQPVQKLLQEKAIFNEFAFADFE
jgi:hypothetical protein